MYLRFDIYYEVSISAFTYSLDFMKKTTMDGIPVFIHVLVCLILKNGVHASTCSTKFSDASFLRDFNISASSESTKNKASDVFTVGWCASGSDTGSPHLNADFKLPYGISSIVVASPTNKDSNPYPTSVLVKYVPNGGNVNDFVDFPLKEGKLEIKMTQPGQVQSNFGTGIAARKLQFTIQSFHGEACLKIDLIGCTISELCTGGCQQNGGLCMAQDMCQCPQGTLGDNCKLKACVPADLGLADGRIGADHVTASSQDPEYTKAEIGNADNKKGWCPSLTEKSPWVQIRLDQPKAVSVFKFSWSQKGGQTIMTEFELQYIAAVDSTRRFRTFAENIPALNSTHVFQVTIDQVVVTDTIRIIPSKWNVRPCFKLEIQGCDPKALCSADWCQNGGTCMGENVCVCPKGFVGNRCEQTANQISATNMTFLKIEKNIIVTTTTTLQFLVSGSVHLHVVDNRPIVTINGTNSSILLQNNGTPSCVTDVNMCTNGFTLAVDINFAHLLENTYIVSSGGNLPDHSGIALYYSNNQLHYIVSTTTQTWTVVVNYPPVLHTWQHFELTWNKHLGIEILVNGHSLGSNAQPSPKPNSSKVVNLCIGCSHTSINVNINMQITAIHSWSLDRTELVNAGVKEPPATATTPVSTDVTAATTKPTSPTTAKPSTAAATTAAPVTIMTTPPPFLQYNLTFLSVINNILVTPTFNFTLHNKPTLEPENNSHTALVLDCSKQQYVELPDQGIPCLESLKNCSKGFTFKLEVLFTKLEPVKKIYIFSSGGDAVGSSGMATYIQSNQLMFGVKQGFMHWNGRYNITGLIQTNKWYKLEVSWEASKGILVIVDGYEVIKDSNWTPSPPNDKTNPVLIGKIEGFNETACMKVRDLFTWTKHREVLVDQGYVQETGLIETTTKAATTTLTEGTITSTSSTLRMYSETYPSLNPTASTTSSGQHWRFEDAIKADCSSTGWNISMDINILRLLYPGITDTDIYLGSEKCHGSRYDNVLWFQQMFDTCMTAEKDVDGTTLFQNTLFYAIFDLVDPSMVRRHVWTYSVACYLTKEETATAHLHHSVESHSTNITGHRDITLAFYRDQNFLHQITGNLLKVHVGDKIYVKVMTAIPDWNTKMRLHTCYTRPSDKTTQHFLITDGCEVDSSTHIISQSTHETKFVFQDFEYLTFDEGLDIFCSATFCDASDFSPECTQACRQGPSIIG